MLKIVLDTNTILSASLFGGMVEIIIDLILANKLQLFVSPDLKHEIEMKLNYFQAAENIIMRVVAVLKKGVLVTPTINITACRDINDNFCLELAETAKVDYLITRD